jgi:putative ABC transport system permease protein
MIAWSLFPHTSHAKPDELIRIEIAEKRSPIVRPLKFSEFALIKGNGHHFLTDVACAVRNTANVLIEGQPEGMGVAGVSFNFFSCLGVSAALGRTFLPIDASAEEHGAVLTHSLWKRRFGGEKDVLGQAIIVNGKPYRIIGVLPASYSAPRMVIGDIYVPEFFSTEGEFIRSIPRLFVFARLRHVTITDAAAQIEGAFETDQGKVSSHGERPDIRLSPIDAIQPSAEMIRLDRLYWISVGAVAILYAIGCLNAGSLVLAKTVARFPQLAIRIALGASRLSIIRLVGLEVCILSLLAIALGIVLAHWILPLCLAALPWAGSTEPTAAPIDQRMMAGLIAVGALTSLALTAVPAFYLSRGGIARFLSEAANNAINGRRSRLIARSLIAAQVAMTAILLIGAAHMLRTFAKLQGADWGYDRSSKLLANIIFPIEGLTGTEKQAAGIEAILASVASIPQVEGVSLANGINTYYLPRSIEIVGQDQRLSCAVETVDAHFFATLGIPLLAGDSLDQFQHSERSVGVINETAARMFFRGNNPVGEAIVLDDGTKVELVGVVGDLRSPANETKPIAYLPRRSSSHSGGLILLVHVANVATASIGAEIKQAVYNVSPEAAVLRIYTVDDIWRDQAYGERFIASSLNLLAVIALCVCTAGVYALVHFTATGRRAEFGIRLALGATRGQICRLAVREEFIAGLMGLAVGVLISIGTSPLLRAALFEIPTIDVASYLAVATLLIFVLIISSLMPVHAATKLDPSQLLRER